MKFDNKGNTVPILEKLDRGLVGCLLTPNIIDSINYLIDVLTEQQDRLDRHNNRIEETNKHFGNKIKDLQKEIELLETYIKDHNIWHYTEKSYTAMRSTGGSGATGEPPYGTYPIKPQEDVRVKIAILLHDEFDEVMDVRVMTYYQDIANKILAIVKGE